MKKKPPSRQKSVIPLKPKKLAGPKVVNFFEKQQKKTEDEMADFVKEIVKLKKKQAKIKSQYERKEINAKARAGLKAEKFPNKNNMEVGVKTKKKTQKTKPKKKPKLKLVK